MTESTKILVLDIETSPNLAFVWGLFKQNIALNQIEDVGQVISFAAKWHGSRKIEFHADYDFATGKMTGHRAMLQRAHELIDEADIVVHWNGTSFDIPHLNREFLLAGLRPPAPHKNLDLYQQSKRKFRFTSHKLDHVAQQLGVGAKVSHTGFDMWRACLSGEDAAWRLMRKYNRMDVEITDLVYDRLRPWVQHPHVGLFTLDPETNRCGRCGSERLQARGYEATSLGKYHRYQCKDCGGWGRFGRRVVGVNARPVA